LTAAGEKQPSEPVRDHAITLDDYFTLAYLTESEISPGGDYVAYAEARWEQSTDDRKADVWLVNTKNGKTTRLTFDRASYGSLKWDHDGKSVYATGKRKRAGETTPPHNGTLQVWRLGVDGGEPVPVTSVADGIELYDVTPDGRFLFYATSRKEAAGDWESLVKEFDGPEYGDGRRDVTEIFKLDLQTWRTAKVAKLERAVAELATTPDGRKLALVTAPENQVVSFEGHSALEILDVATGKTITLPDKLWRKEAPSPYGRLNSLAWSLDGKALAFVIGFDGFPSEIIVARWTQTEPTLYRLPRPAGVSLEAGVDSQMPMRWQKGSSDLCFLGTEKARLRVYCAANHDAGNAPEFSCLTPGDVCVDTFSFDASGKNLAFIQGDPKHFQDIFLTEGKGEPRQLTRVNSDTDSWKIPSVSTVSWKGSGGTDVEGVLELPFGAEPGKPLPLIVNIHGGPTAVWPDRLQFTYFGNTLFPSQGYAVFSPNYRGSTGYGDKFLTDLIGRGNDVEVADILKGVDALVERKIADPNRLGVSGWSNGGYLTNCLIGRTDRFKAASSGAGIADLVTEWGTNDEPAYSVVFIKGFPWNKAAEFQRVSPVFEFGKVHTPTIIHVGAKDPRCPQGNSRMLHRSLKEYLHVPTQLVVYPDEPHGLGRYKNRKAKMAWDVAWFKRYIK
jgi:dipeptidyl aminopeptidase/acylaminoacyl peptidase